MNTGTYVQCIAHNYHQSMAPFPDHLDIADEVRGDGPADRLRGGLAGLHWWMAAVYRGAADAPGDFGLPCHPHLLPRSGPKYTASVRAFEAIPALILALGLLGAPQARGGQAALCVDQESLTAHCRQAGIRKPSVILDALGKYGLEAAPDPGTPGSLAIRFPDAPDITFALPALVKACRALTKKADRPPLEFYRADMRVMQPVKGRRRPPPVTVADALRPLART